MHEILFTNSPITIIFSATALLLTFAFPTILGQKTGLKRFPKAIYQLMLICIFWNASSLVGGIFFGGFLIAFKLHDTGGVFLNEGFVPLVKLRELLFYGSGFAADCANCNDTGNYK